MKKPKIREKQDATFSIRLKASDLKIIKEAANVKQWPMAMLVRELFVPKCLAIVRGAEAQK